MRRTRPGAARLTPEAADHRSFVEGPVFSHEGFQQLGEVKAARTSGSLCGGAPSTLWAVARGRCWEAGPRQQEGKTQGLHPAGVAKEGHQGRRPGRGTAVSRVRGGWGKARRRWYEEGVQRGNGRDEERGGEGNCFQTPPSRPSWGLPVQPQP